MTSTLIHMPHRDPTAAPAREPLHEEIRRHGSVARMLAARRTDTTIARAALARWTQPRTSPTDTASATSRPAAGTRLSVRDCADIAAATAPGALFTVTDGGSTYTEHYADPLTSLHGSDARPAAVTRTTRRPKNRGPRHTAAPDRIQSGSATISWVDGPTRGAITGAINEHLEALGSTCPTALRIERTNTAHGYATALAAAILAGTQPAEEPFDAAAGPLLNPLAVDALHCPTGDHDLPETLLAAGLDHEYLRALADELLTLAGIHDPRARLGLSMPPGIIADAAGTYTLALHAATT